MDAKYLGSSNSANNICLINSATTYAIFKNKEYFSNLEMGETNVIMINGSAKLKRVAHKRTNPKDVAHKELILEKYILEKIEIIKNSINFFNT